MQVDWKHKSFIIFQNKLSFSVKVLFLLWRAIVPFEVGKINSIRNEETPCDVTVQIPVEKVGHNIHEAWSEVRHYMLEEADRRKGNNCCFFTFAGGWVDFIRRELRFLDLRFLLLGLMGHRQARII